MTEPTRGTSYGITATAARFGISVEALRYYESEGLIEVARDPSGRRVYDERTCDALAIVMALRGAGFGVRDIAQFLAAKAPESSTEERLTAAEGELARLREAVAERRRALDAADELLVGWQREIDEYRAE